MRVDAGPVGGTYSGCGRAGAQGNNTTVGARGMPGESHRGGRGDALTGVTADEPFYFVTVSVISTVCDVGTVTLDDVPVATSRMV